MMWDLKKSVCSEIEQDAQHRGIKHISQSLKEILDTRIPTLSTFLAHRNHEKQTVLSVIRDLLKLMES